MKNILIIHESMTLGGAENVLSTLLEYIDYTEYSITLLLLFNKGTFLKRIPEQVKVIGVFEDDKSLIYRLIDKNYAFKNFFFEKVARHKLQGCSFDTIVSFMEGPAASLHSSIMDMAQRNVSWIHTDISKYYWYRRYFRRVDEKQFYSRLDEIVFVSDYIKQSFCSLYDMDVRKTTIYNPVDIDEIERKSRLIGVEKRRFTICCVGRLVKPKRLDRVVEVVTRLKKSGIDVDCWFIGSGYCEDELRHQCKENGADGNIKFMGFMENPFPYIREADLLLHTADFEGFAMVLPEAMSLGTPVVTTPFDVAFEILSSGGGIVSSFDVDQLTADVASLVTDREKYNRLASETKEAASRFVLKETVNKVNRVL